MVANHTFAIETKKLFFFYQKLSVLKDINIQISPKNITALIGPSGSGKSTLLRVFNLMFALHKKQEAQGEVWVEGQDILHEEVDVNLLRKKVGMVFQKPTPFPMSIYENIAFPLRLHQTLDKNTERERVEDLLRQVFLWDEVKDKLDRSAYALSGGQQQRLCFARTLATEPSILLLDEPTSSLDPASTHKIEELISLFKEKQYTIIMVTHHLKQAKRLASETIFLKQGHIIEQGKTDQLFSQPQQPETREYILDL